jgi:hypothetical protein
VLKMSGFPYRASASSMASIQKAVLTAATTEPDD